jgi:putative transposase
MQQFLETPWYGSRQMTRHLRRLGHAVGRKRVRRLMATMGLAPIYQRPRATVSHPAHRIYPYLLRDLVIDRPNQVWCADITYIPMRRGFLYLVAVMDWSTRRVLSWRLSNTMDVEFCIGALEEALARFGRPEIFNSDQGRSYDGGRQPPLIDGSRPSHLPWRRSCPAHQRRPRRAEAIRTAIPSRSTSRWN